MSVPKWINDHWESYDHEICMEDCILRNALSTAIKALQNIRYAANSFGGTPMPHSAYYMACEAAIAIDKIAKMGEA